jgi:hypothetical protein
MPYSTPQSVWIALWLDTSLGGRSLTHGKQEMNLTFHNPFFLYGLAAAILPILIHRITQRKPEVRKFSAVRLLLQSQRTTSRPRRLKHLLLLILRILAIAAIVFMMARPVLERPGFATLLPQGAKVLIVDNSLSMGYREDRGQRYDIAKRAAQKALEGFEGRIALIPTGSLQRGPAFEWMNAQEALTALQALPLSFARGETESAFTSAYQQLKNLRMPKQILILSDLARSDWEGFDLTRLGVISDADVTFFRIGPSTRDPNFCIKEVSLTEGEILAGVPTRLAVTVSNLSDQAATTLVQIYLSGVKAEQKSIDLKPGQNGKVFFELLVDKPGWIDAEIKLSPDRLRTDDVFYFPMKVKNKVNILVVDGDPKTSLKASESYFLVSALHPGAFERSPFTTRVITENEMARTDLRSYDSIFLLNVARPDFSRLASFLEMERPVFIFLGDRIVAEEYNQFSLAPWQIKGINDLNDRAEKITQVDLSREARKLLTQLEDSLKSVSVRRYFKIEGTAKNLLTLGNNAPLLLEAEVEKSKLFMFASSADLDWNDLPLKAAYLPLLHGLLKEAMGLTGSFQSAEVRFGEPFPEKGRPVQIKGPKEGPGIFQFQLPTGELRRGVNTPYEESDLTKVSGDELKKKFGAIDVQVLEYQNDGQKGLRGGRKELWPSLLIFLLAILTLEIILANGIWWYRT